MHLWAFCETPPTFAGSAARRHPGFKSSKTFRVMTLIAILLFAAILNANAKGYSQITVEAKNIALQKLFRQIGRQSGFDFLYSYEVLKKSGNV